MSASEAESGFNLAGHLTTRMGLGRAARMTLDLMERNRFPVRIVDVHFRGLDRIPLDSGAQAGDLTDLPYSATVLHMNPEQLVDGLLVWDPALLGALARRYLVTVPYWELPVLPSYWQDSLLGMDEILAPSHYIEGTLNRAFASQPSAPRVTHFAQAVRPPDNVAPARERWFGGRSATTVFLASLDLVSDPARKNPQGVVAAFQAAAEQRDDLTLVLKMGYPQAVSSNPEYGRLLDAVRSDPRIVVIEESLGEKDMWSLLASADAYVSLHRAEGLGLGLMESMALGTPVAGTAWSGNTDFMSADDSILVPYTLVPVAAHGAPLYRELSGKTEWAEPSLTDAAKAIRALGDSAELRARLGLAARASSERRWQQYLLAEPLRAVLDSAESFDLESPARSERISRLQREVRRRARTARLGDYRASSMTERVKRNVVHALRIVGLKPPAPDEEIRDNQSGPLQVVDPFDLPTNSEGVECK